MRTQRVEEATVELTTAITEWDASREADSALARAKITDQTTIRASVNRMFHAQEAFELALDRLAALEFGVDPSGRWELYWGPGPLPVGATAQGTVTRTIGDTGALIKMRAGRYVQGNAGAIRNLPQAPFREAPPSPGE